MIRNNLSKIFVIILLIAFILSGCGNSSNENFGYFVESDSFTESEKENITESNLLTDINTDGLVLAILSVGDASSQIVQVDGKTMVVDVGDVSDTKHVKGCLDALGVENLEAVVLSHAHSDHLGGYEALRDYDINKSYISPQANDTEIYEKAIDFIEEKSEEVIVPEVGDTFALGSATVEFLAPRQSDYTDLNNSSLVIRITYGNNSFLLPGDMEGIEAEEMIEDYEHLESDVFVAAHHGSNSDGANSYYLLRTVNPLAVVISSAGEESEYGFPHEEVLSRINDLGAKLYRTDLLGDIVITSDGKDIEFNKEKIEMDKNDSIDYGLESQNCYIGNLNSKKFHFSTCSSLPAEHNRIYFKNREDAVKLGYSPCGICNP